ncbi:permease [Hydrogenimonas sp.]
MKIKWMGTKFLAFVAVLYAVLAFIDAHKTLEALLQAGKVLAELVPILMVVMLLTVYVHYRFEPKKLAAHLGEESGVKGWAVALGLGVLSHGPMYAWYPMFRDMMRHGLRKGLVAAFFYARAVKVPILPIMVQYFGLAFTLSITLYTLLAAWVQGVLIEKLCAGKPCDPE